MEVGQNFTRSVVNIELCVMVTALPMGQRYREGRVRVRVDGAKCLREERVGEH